MSPLALPRASLAAVLLAVLAAPAFGEPLHEAASTLPVAASEENLARRTASASDAEFLRASPLTSPAPIPTSDARAFLNDNSPDKRARLIDRLLASPEYARHMQVVFDVMLMERRPDKNYVPRLARLAGLPALRTSFADNKPWDVLIREILSADGTDPKTRPAAKFLLDRDAEPNQSTRDIARLFLGMNLQCAQCHDHPLVEHYKQADFYGVFAFLSRTTVFTEKANNLTVLAEKAEGEVTYQSVFDPKKETKKTTPVVPGSKPIVEPVLEKGKEYEVAPAAGIRPVPKFSRRAQLAGEIATKDNERFRRNIANRLWALLMGRGLVYPLDLDHPDNPPSHPELLTLLADEIATTKFDVRGFLREIAAQARRAEYQRLQRVARRRGGGVAEEPGSGAAETAVARATGAVLDAGDRVDRRGAEGVGQGRDGGDSVRQTRGQRRPLRGDICRPAGAVAGQRRGNARPGAVSVERQTGARLVGAAARHSLTADRLAAARRSQTPSRRSCI